MKTVGEVSNAEFWHILMLIFMSKSIEVSFHKIYFCNIPLVVSVGKTWF